MGKSAHCSCGDEGCARKESELGTQLCIKQLALSKSLPLKPDAKVLKGRFITLEPYDEASHFEQLYEVCSGRPVYGHPAYDWDAGLWRFLLSPSFSGAGGVEGARAQDGSLKLESFRAQQRARADAPDRRMWVMVLNNSVPGFAPSEGGVLANNRVVGQLGLMRNTPADLTTEIGFVVATPAVQRTPVVTEATYLLLKHAFSLGYRRVEWKTNARNARSRAAALRTGFSFEGVFRQHMIVHDGWVHLFTKQTTVSLGEMKVGACSLQVF